jgi:hypothetical protein
MAVSGAFTPTMTGTYYFNVTYSGDGNYTSANSSMTGEPLTVSKATPTVTTTLSATTITLGGSVTDTANVTDLGGNFANATGTVTFGVEYPNGTWTTYGGTPSINSSGIAISSTFTPLLSTGTYYFNVTYSGDGNYTSANSSMTGEPLTVSKATPTLATLVNQTGITTAKLGNVVNDQVTVTGIGGVTPTGTVNFIVTCPNGSVITYDSGETLAGGTANSKYITLLSTGGYSFNVTYSGDSNYNASTLSSLEPLSVTKATTPTLATLVNQTGITTAKLGNVVNDQVTVTGIGGVTPTGTVNFIVTCPNGSVITYDSGETLAGGTANSKYITILSAGTYSFNVTYSGDSNYTSATLSTLEILTVSKATPTVTTTLSAATITLGGSVTDTANVTGLGGSFPVPTGTVTFGVEYPNGTWTTYGGTPSINSSGMAVSGAFTPTMTGTYYFNVTYSGDGNYTSATSSITAEKLTVFALFGNTAQGSSYFNGAIDNTIRGYNFTLLTGNAYANSITAALSASTSGTWNISCAIYFASNGTLVGNTGYANTALTTTITWYTFTFSNPPLLYNNTLYRLVIWANNPSGTAYLAYSSGGTAGASESVTFGAWPNPLNGMTSDTHSYSIYCNVT